MATPVNPTDLPRNPQRTRSRKAKPSHEARRTPPPSPNPQLIPLLDLLADLIAQDIRKQRKALNEHLGDEGFDTDAPASVQAASSSDGEKPAKTGPFPSFPAKSHPEYHQNPNNHPPADEPMQTKEKKS